MTIKKKDFKKAIPKSRGVISNMARVLGCNWGTVKHCLNRWPELNELFLQEKEKLLDNCENGLYEAIDQREQWAIKFTLQTLGKDRGYVEKTEIKHSGGLKVPPMINVQIVKNGEPPQLEK